MLTYQGTFLADKVDGGGPVLPQALVLDADIPEGQQSLPLHGGARGHLPEVIRHQLFLQIDIKSHCPSLDIIWLF